MNLPRALPKSSCMAIVIDCWGLGPVGQGRHLHAVWTFGNFALSARRTQRQTGGRYIGHASFDTCYTAVTTLTQCRPIPEPCCPRVREAWQTAAGSATGRLPIAGSG